MKPIWTERHSKIVKDFQERRTKGELVTFTFVENQLFFDSLYDRPTSEIVSVSKDEIGNKCYLMARNAVLP